MIKDFNAAIFDLDGTLLESMGVWKDIDIEFLRKRNLPMTDDYLKDITPLGFEAAAQYTIRRFHLTDTPQELIAEWQAMAEDEYRYKVGLKPNAGAYVKMLHERGVKIAAATSSDRHLVEPALDRNGILPYFSYIVTVRDVTRGKGFPDIYWKAAELLEERPEDCMVFEDILKGVQGARDGGFRIIGVEDTYSLDDRAEIQRFSEAYISDFRELMR